jgi:hypothetical protein
MLPYTAGDTLQAIAREYGIDSLPRVTRDIDLAAEFQDAGSVVMDHEISNRSMSANHVWTRFWRSVSPLTPR